MQNANSKDALIFVEYVMPIKESPTWSQYKSKIRYPALTGDLSADVVIIGGGLAGILTAYMLTNAGREVIVLEKDTIGSGATEYTTAFITQSIDTEYQKLIKMFGKAKAKLIKQSHGMAIDTIEAIVKKEQIDCDFKRISNFTYTNTAKDLEMLEEEYLALKKDGFDVYLKRPKYFPFKNYGALEWKNQAKFNPLKFLNALTSILKSRGTSIYEKTEVLKISGKENITVTTKDSTIKGRQVIIATYQPLGNPKQTFAKKGMYVSYVLEAQIPHGLIKEATYEDTENPYHYFRIDIGKGFDHIILGGEDHRSELKINANKTFKALEHYLIELLGSVPYKIVRKWRGPILEPSDGIALIGEFKPKHYVATAFSGNGMTYSAISAILLTSLITNKKNKWTKLYDPKRIPTVKQLLLKGKDYAEEFFKGAVKNSLVRDK